MLRADSLWPGRDSKQVESILTLEISSRLQLLGFSCQGTWGGVQRRKKIVWDRWGLDGISLKPDLKIFAFFFF